MKTLALCLNIRELQDSYLDPDACARYPGSGFLPYLARLAKDEGYTVLGGAHAKGLVSSGALSGADVRVLQEELNSDGLALTELGAEASALFCMESKMYAPFFYDSLPELKRTFKRQILFDGGTDRLYFPSFDLKELEVARPSFSIRKPLCMIASNKQYQTLLPAWYSPAWCSAVRNQLHSMRLRAIDEYGDEMDLYGYGWEHLDNLPPEWAHLKDKIKRIYKGTIPPGGKLSVLAQYQYAVCYENVAEPGYVTEKMIDCLVAGTKPLYRGPNALSVSGRVDPQVSERELPKYSYQAFAGTVMKCLEAA